LVVLAACIPIVINFRGVADRLASRPLNRALHKTYRQAVWYQRGGAAVFVVVGVVVVVAGVVEIAHGNP
jgi:hypothetical protein